MENEKYNKKPKMLDSFLKSLGKAEFIKIITYCLDLLKKQREEHNGNNT